MKYASIESTIWTKPWFIDTNNATRLVFLWCITNPHKNCTGIYEAHIQTISTGSLQSQAETLKALDTLAELGKVFYTDGYVIVANWSKHNNYNNQNVRQFVYDHIQSLPKSLITKHLNIINMVMKKAGFESIHAHTPAHGIAHSLPNPMTTPLPISEVEVEEEVEVEGEVEAEQKEKCKKENSVPISPEIQELLDHAQSCVEKTVNEGKESGVLIGKKSNHTMLLTQDHLKTFMSENDNDTDMVKAMLTVFYQWKTVKATRVIKSDYLSMREVWVKEAAHKYLEQNPPPHDMRKYWSEGTLVTTDQYMNVLLPLANGNYDILNNAIEIADQAWRESKDKKRKSVNYVRAIIERRMS